MLLFLTLTVCAFAQDAGEISRAEMKKVDWSLGQWEGEGWVESQSGGKLTFTANATTQSKLDGLVFLLEGSNKFRRPGDDSKVIINSHVSILNYDQKAKCYHLRSYREDGSYRENELKYVDHTFHWETRDENQGMNQRFTMRLGDDGRLIYTGETSPDQTNWHEFFHAVYRRVNKAAQ